MYLKSLELQGFKSFPDKIRLTFDQGMTAVVGPNGSGKSNIGDAVRWVLGEQSTKELRSKSMEDVIFSGTKVRKPMGFAAVTLTIDNSDHALSDPEAEVAVTRRLYRNGDSEYLINGRNVRLKDVNELFMDTGLGRDGYAIIGQGRIAEIVGAKSNERRDIFEEAAGVSRFRYKKQEAERKLQQAEDNLVRLTDIAAELESRIGPLKTQAEKAEKYLVLAAERRTLEVSYWVHRLGLLTANLQELSDRYLAVTAEYENLTHDLEREEEKYQLAYSEMQQATADVETLQNKIVASEQDNAAVIAQIAVCENEITHGSERIADFRRQMAELSETGTEWEQRLAEQDAYIATLTEQQITLENELHAMEAALDALMTQTEAQNESVTEQDTAVRALYLEQNERRVRIAGMEEEERETAESIRRAEEEGADTETRLKGYAEQVQALEKKIEALEGAVTEQQNRLDGAQQLSGLREQKYRQVNEKLAALNTEYSEVSQKQQILRDLERSMEGYAGSVRQVLRVAGSGRLGGVHGTVAQRIDVSTEYGTAIETALGGALQNIIVENEDAAKRCIRYLKEVKGGRATFLPLTTVRGSRLREDLDGIDGFVALAVDLVKFDPAYQNIMDSLLGKIAVAEDIDAASAIAKRFQYKFRIVTLDGQLIHTGGSYTGGSASHSAGVITRGHELEEAGQRLKELSEERERLQAESAKRKAEWAKLLTDVEGAAAKIGELREEQQALRQEKAAIEARAASDAAWQENEAEQRQRLCDKLESVRSARKAASEELEKLNETVSEAEKKLREDSVEQARMMSERELLNGQIGDMKIRLTGQQKDIETERTRRINMAQTMEQAADRSASLAESVKQEKAAISDRQKEIAMLTEGQALRRQSITDMQERITELRRIHDEKEQYSRLVREGMDGIRDAREKQSAERTRVEERQGTVQREIDDMIFRLQESYELTRTEAESEAEPVTDPKDTETRLTSVKNRIRALGQVNVGAVDEYREVSARYTDLSAQLTDIEKAKTDLTALIAQLTSEMCTIFRDSFAKINRYFGEIFSDLFGGGSASLELTDPDNVLESGIEIKVAPPGKVIKNLIQLSGGEQSFIAICIYFAILRLRPAPFCVLDEIDAALDEVNVRKYALYLKANFSHVQFVVVTHRRGAMEEANVLYGVTMQEDGISRLLRLDQSGAVIPE